MRNHRGVARNPHFARDQNGTYTHKNGAHKNGAKTFIKTRKTDCSPRHWKLASSCEILSVLGMVGMVCPRQKFFATTRARGGATRTIATTHKSTASNSRPSMTNQKVI